MAKDKVSASTAVGRSELGSILGVSSSRIGQLGACRELAPSNQESTTYRPGMARKLLILGSREPIPDRLLDDYKEASVRMAGRFWLILHGCRNAWIDRIVRAMKSHPDSPIGAVSNVMADMQLDVQQQLGATRTSARIGRLHAGADPEESEAERPTHGTG